MALSRDQLINLIVDYANAYGIDPAIAIEQHRRESANFRSDVIYGPFVGAAGERGLSQFTPGTWARFGYGPHPNAYDPDYSLTAWGNYMNWLLTRYGWDYSKALMAYNGGEGNVDRGTVSAAARRYATEILERSGRTIWNEPAPDTIATQPPTTGGGFPAPAQRSLFVPLLIGGILVAVLAARD